MQFHAFRNPYRGFATQAPYFVVLQSDELTGYRSVVVAPLVPDKSVGRARIFHPRFEIEGKQYAIDMLQVGAIPRKDLGEPVAELDRYRVIDAYDALISGTLS